MFELLELKDKFAQETVDEWNRQINQFTTDEDLLLETMYRSKLNYMTNSSEAVFYGLKINDQEHVSAILELTLKKPEGSGLRLLNIILEPNLDADNRSIDIDLRFVVKVISNSITKAFKLTYNQIPAKTFKIYGRTDATMTILKFVSEAIKEEEMLSKSLETKFEGRWLLIDKIK